MLFLIHSCKMKLRSILSSSSQSIEAAIDFKRPIYEGRGGWQLAVGTNKCVLLKTLLTNDMHNGKKKKVQ